MISKVLHFWKQGASYVVQHSKLLVVLLLLIVLPLLFLYSGQQFLDAGRANQERLQKDRIGTMHDAFVSLARGTGVETELIQEEVQNYSETNEDIALFSIQHLVDQQLRTIVSSDTSEVGTSTTLTDVYKNAAIRFDESLIFETFSQSGRLWYSYRAFEVDDETYFITTIQSLSAVDSALQQRERTAYSTLVLLYVFMIALTYWHVRMINYQALYNAAVAENAAKDSFLHLTAHELRSPLTAIRGYASMQLESKSVDQGRQYAERIQLSSERMLALINELLDVARIRSGKLTMELASITLKPIVENVIAELSVTAHEHSLVLTHEIDPLVSVQADVTRLQQVLINLVTNAIKYTNEGSITIRCKEKRDSVEIRIADTGTGIEADAQKQLFAPFYRVENAETADITGTGLGMWITKLLVAEMQGSISVESIKDVGTHVVVKLPRGKSDA